MEFTPFVIATFPDFPPGHEINIVPSLEYTIPSTLLYIVLAVSKLIAVKPVQPKNALSVKPVALLGIVTLLRLVQP
jgi:hypothetical protein